MVNDMTPEEWAEFKSTQQIQLIKKVPTYADLNPNDVVFTPEPIAERIVKLYNLSGKILEPCKGLGAFMKYLPSNTEWCEITEGRNFFDYKHKVDWIVTNPPYSNFNEFLDHSFEISDNIVWLTPFSKVFKSVGTMRKIREYGGIKSIHLIPANKCGFPFGYPCGVFHFIRNYKGQTDIVLKEDWYESVNTMENTKRGKGN